MTKEFSPNWVSAPGNTILDVLLEREISPQEFADGIDEELTFVERLIIGDEIIDGDVAQALSDYLGSTKEFWLSREKAYRSDMVILGVR